MRLFMAQKIDIWYFVEVPRALTNVSFIPSFLQCNFLRFRLPMVPLFHNEQIG